MYQGVISISAFSVTLLLASCGQRGPLYLLPAKDNVKIAAQSKTVDEAPTDAMTNNKPVGSDQKMNNKDHHSDLVALSTSEPLKNPVN